MDQHISLLQSNLTESVAGGLNISSLKKPHLETNKSTSAIVERVEQGVLLLINLGAWYTDKSNWNDQKTEEGKRSKTQENRKNTDERALTVFSRSEDGRTAKRRASHSKPSKVRGVERTCKSKVRSTEGKTRKVASRVGKEKVGTKCRNATLQTIWRKLWEKYTAAWTPAQKRRISEKKRTLLTSF